ncbi:hypothetical protein F5Y18DRAFT_441516 [Xylariaceae sp. FL1019]|nr:hypothetical protein F5Y18DRAFT_441516 [Xylariaceae sp. FL1019]
MPFSTIFKPKNLKTSPWEGTQMFPSFDYKTRLWVNKHKSLFSALSALAGSPRGPHNASYQNLGSVELYDNSVPKGVLVPNILAGSHDFYDNPGWPYVAGPVGQVGNGGHEGGGDYGSTAPKAQRKRTRAEWECIYEERRNGTSTIITDIFDDDKVKAWIINFPQSPMPGNQGYPKSFRNYENIEFIHGHQECGSLLRSRLEFPIFQNGTIWINNTKPGAVRAIYLHDGISTDLCGVVKHDKEKESKYSPCDYHEPEQNSLIALLR